MKITREDLKKAMENGLPGENIQWEMASSDRLFSNFPRQPRHDTVEAAVLILLYEQAGQIYTLFIQRPGYDGIHGGQISFPGGKRDLNDKTPEETALRETEEETGLLRRNIQISGMLTPLYIYVSNINVIPFVGWYEDAPAFDPCKSEVDFIIEADVSRFLDGKITRDGVFDVRGEKVRIKYFDYNGYVIWGATAMIFNELLAIIKKIR